MTTVPLTAPFPYFGGKRTVAAEVWARFGDVPNYIEPFCGTAAVLLARPEVDGMRTETINDANCFVANFWRATACDVDLVAHHADNPINEADLHARHRWLMIGQAAEDFIHNMKTDPDYYDPKVAGWWVWGQSSWIGGGWCAGRHLDDGDGGASNQLPKIDKETGIHQIALRRPKLSGNTEAGIHALAADKSGKASAALEQRRSDLSNAHGLHARHIHLGRAYAIQSGQNILARLSALRDRLRYVRVTCGDWSRITSRSVTTFHGVTGVFLDPPYSDKAGRDPELYAVDDLNVAHAVREWAIANGDNPLFRIALCGYEGEHQMPDTWSVHAWKTQGGYGHIHKANNVAANSKRERIWFSPHCLAARQGALFDPADQKEHK